MADFKAFGIPIALHSKGLEPVLQAKRIHPKSFGFAQSLRHNSRKALS